MTQRCQTEADHRAEPNEMGLSTISVWIQGLERAKKEGKEGREEEEAKRDLKRKKKRKKKKEGKVTT